MAVGVPKTIAPSNNTSPTYVVNFNPLPKSLPPDLGELLRILLSIYMEVIFFCTYNKSRGPRCYLSRICFANWVRQEIEMFNLFLSNKVSNSKNEFQTRFETRSRYSHTPPETAVIVNRERINNLLLSIYVGSNWNPNTITKP